MRGLSSNVLSITAMGLSTLTTYLTFFDASFVLTTANAGASVRIFGSGGKANGERSVQFEFRVKSSVILSNRGKLAVVVSDIRAFKSTALDACQIARDDKGQSLTYRVDNGPPIPRVVEPETLQQLEIRFQLDKVKQTVPDGSAISLPSSESLWCLKWVIFDPNGVRHEVTSPVLRAARTYIDKGLDKRPEADIELDITKKPVRLVSRSVF